VTSQLRAPEAKSRPLCDAINLLVSLAEFGVPVVALGAGASGLAGVLGHYFGRGLRSGLSKEV